MAHLRLLAVFVASLPRAPWADEGRKQVTSTDEPVASLAGSLVISGGGLPGTQAKAAAVAALLASFNVSSGVLGIFMVEGSGPRRLGVPCTSGLPAGMGIDTSGCSGTQPGESCTLRCMTGFLANEGNHDVVCGSDGIYTESDLECHPVFCPDLSDRSAFASTMLAHTCSQVYVGQRCHVYCSSGYDLAGYPKEYTCTLTPPNLGSYLDESGQPATAPPICIPRRCTINIPNRLGLAHDCDGKMTGQTCTVTNAPGFNYKAGSGQMTLTCGTDGALQGALPEVAPARCGDLPSAAGMSDTCRSKAANTFCWAYCLPPFTGSMAQYKCQFSGGGMAYVPVSANVSCSCTGANCPTRRLLDSPATAVPSGACDEGVTALGLGGEGIIHNCLGRRNGDSCIASCMEGYHMEGYGTQEGRPSMYTCLAGTLVGAAPPKCVPKACTSGLPSGEGVIHNCEGVVAGTTCKAGCGAGYSGDAEQVFSCTHSGMLIGRLPVCTPSPCKALLLPEAYFTTDCVGVKIGGKCSVHCAAPLVGKSEGFSCSASGQLEGALPKCYTPAAVASSVSPSGSQRMDYVICSVAQKAADMEHTAQAIASDRSHFAAQLQRTSGLVLEGFSSAASSAEGAKICESRLKDMARGNGKKPIFT